MAEPMTTILDLAALQALEAKATPGEWRWNVNLSSRCVYLESTGRGQMLEHVMDFARWGMGGAAPRFRSQDDLMVRADELTAIVPGREHHSRWYRTLSHPDAELIAATRNALPALLAAASERDELRAANADLLACVDRAETAYCALERERDELRTDNATLTEAVAKARSVAREWEELCEKLTTELSRWPEEIAAALCATVKADRTVETWAAHVRREHEAHTETWSRFRDAKDESAALQAEVAALKAKLLDYELAAKYPGDDQRHRGASVASQLVHAQHMREKAEAKVEQLQGLCVAATALLEYVDDYNPHTASSDRARLRQALRAAVDRALSPAPAAKESRMRREEPYDDSPEARP